MVNRVVLLCSVLFLFTACGTEAELPAKLCQDVDCGEHGVCAEGADSHVCVCEPGYGSLAGAPCAAIPKLCEGHDCGAEGLCVEAEGQVACLCEAGNASLSGAPCTPIPDVCVGTDCGEQGLCVDNNGSPVCFCASGFVVGANGACEAQTTVCATTDCGAHGFCIDAANSPLCLCEPGYDWVGGGCVSPVDPCFAIDCGAHGSCVPGVVGGLCVCEDGYSSVGTAPCEAIPVVCQGVDCGVGGVCVETAGSPVCMCQAGYELGTDDKCQAAADLCGVVDCGAHGICAVTSAGAALCLCEDGWKASGLSCVADVSPCDGVSCGGFGQCVVTGANVATCLCDTGYLRSVDGLGCERDAAVLTEFAELDVTQAVYHPTMGAKYIPNALTVYVVETYDPAVFNTELSLLGATTAAYSEDLKRYSLRFSETMSFADFELTRASLEASPQVELVNEIWVADEVDLTVPADSGWGTGSWNEASPSGSNWYLEMIRAASAWDITTGERSPVKIGVIDQGTISHTDIIVTEQRPSAEHVSTFHSTQTAGLIGAASDNDGLTGVMWNAQLYYCETDGSSEDLVKCIKWLLGRGVQVINYSMGVSQREKACGEAAFQCPLAPEYGGVLNDDFAVQLANELATALARFRSPREDWLLVQSAGNEALETQYNRVAVHLAALGYTDHIMIVGGVGEDYQLSAFSNYGNLDLVAPGGSVSFLAGAIWSLGKMVLLTGSDGTTEAQGTSFSAPLVSGAAALLWSMDPSLTAAEVKIALYWGAHDSADVNTNRWVEDPLGNLSPILDLRAAVDRIVAKCAAEGRPFNSATGRCQTPSCTPNCAGKQCGDNGCGGTCGAFFLSRCDASTLQKCVSGTIASTDCAALNAVCKVARTPGTSNYCEPIAVVDAPPTGAILSPANNAIVSADFSVSVSAEDDHSVVGLAVQVADTSGVIYQELTYPGTPSASWTSAMVDTSSWTSGYYWLVVWADDGVNEAKIVAQHVINFRSPVDLSTGMIRIPAAGATTTFTMGCPASDAWCNSWEQPAHTVTLDAYRIDKYEVTAAQYKACVDIGVCTAALSTGNYTYDAVGLENHPINGVDWMQAFTYCDWLGRRLPTEAEWERAAKGETQRRFPWGDNCPIEWSTTECASGNWTSTTAKANGYELTCHDGFAATSPVGSFPSGVSPDGVHDMAGNVYEWVKDWYGASYYSTSPTANPTGPLSGSFRVFRGGSWCYDFDGSPLRAAYRSNGTPGNRYDSLGFRCASSVP